MLTALNAGENMNLHLFLIAMKKVAETLGNNRTLSYKIKYNFII
jgi:hypothetical protein